MASYRVLFRPAVRKDFRRLPKRDVERLMVPILALADDPRPLGCEKLSGLERYRIRQGDYRIVYSIEDDHLVVWVVRVGHRSDGYRRRS